MSDQKITLRLYSAPLGWVHAWAQDDKGSLSIFHYDCEGSGLFSVLVNGQICEAVMNSNDKTIIFDVPPPPNAKIVLIWNEATLK